MWEKEFVVCHRVETQFHSSHIFFVCLHCFVCLYFCLFAFLFVCIFCLLFVFFVCLFAFVSFGLFEFVFDQVEDNPDDMAKTPLHIAAEKGHFEICKMILESKEVQNKTALDSHQSWCPLNFAVYNGQFEVAKLILEHIEDKNPGNQYGTTPLLLAAEFGKTRYLWVYKKNTSIFLLLMRDLDFFMRSSFAPEASIASDNL